MRKLILRISVSIDGFIESSDRKLDFAKTRSPEGAAWVAEKMGQAGVHLLGRKAFCEMASFWPTASGALAKHMNEIPKIVFSKRKPIIGFIGHLNERLDFTLLENLISHNKQWHFVFIGPKETNINVSLTQAYRRFETILKYDNVTWLDQQPKQDIPALIKQFSISMIPYDIHFDFNRYCYPMKLFEYFYVGSPVISTPIEELKKMPDLVEIGKDWKEWQKKIAKILAAPKDINQIKNQQLLCLENSWENKISAISQLINQQT
jgi:glycosyltransferase involved in cell wall biosynthesis